MNKVLENYECDGQLSFAPSGNITPCPYIRDCNTYGIGCQGTSYWCKRFDTKTDRKKELDAKYDIPRDYQKEAGWTDDWHYTELETPKEHGIYYCVSYLLNSENYTYNYMAWAYGYWWAYAGYGEKWLLVRGDRRKWMEPFAWVTVPDLYYRTDPHHQFLCEHFVTKEDWEYEQRLEKIRNR
jgi:hypothetical protein